MCLLLPLFGYSQAPTNGETNGFLDRFYQNETTQTVSPEPGGGWFWVVVRIFLYTAVFAVGGFFLFFYFVKKSAVETTDDAKFIEVIAIKQTGLGGYLEVVKIGATYYILGTTGDVWWTKSQTKRPLTISSSTRTLSNQSPRSL